MLIDLGCIPDHTKFWQDFVDMGGFEEELCEFVMLGLLANCSKCLLRECPNDSLGEGSLAVLMREPECVLCEHRCEHKSIGWEVAERVDWFDEERDVRGM